MVWLGVDLGNARVGLALSDPELTFAHPAGNIHVAGDYFFAIDEVLNVIEDEHVDHVIVGLPLQMDGTEGKSAKKRAGGRPIWRRGCKQRVKTVILRSIRFRRCH